MSHSYLLLFFIFTFCIISTSAWNLSYQNNMTINEWNELKLALKPIIESGHGPLLVRLSWHDAGSWNMTDGTGGPHASMRYQPVSQYEANRGLRLARDLLEPLYQQFNGKISYADLWSFAAAVVISNSGGPIIPWRPGRGDSDMTLLPPDNRLPDGSLGADHLRTIFTRLNFSDQAIVALSGAHVMGSCKPQNSGFRGPWTGQPLRFSHQYFVNLVTIPYMSVQVTFNGTTKQQFNAPPPPPGPGPIPPPLMMLPSDMSLFTDPTFKPMVQAYAASQTLFYQDFTRYFVQLQELGVTHLIANTTIDPIIPGFVQPTNPPPNPPPTPPTNVPSSSASQGNSSESSAANPSSSTPNTATPSSSPNPSSSSSTGAIILSSTGNDATSLSLSPILIILTSIVHHWF